MNTVIIFKDFCMEYFDGDCFEMIKWLNSNLVGFRVHFISKNETIVDNRWRVTSYSIEKNFDGSYSFDDLRVYMNTGQNGYARGLVFLEDINLPDDYKKERIRWYKKGKLE
jgi:hypothetical protein